MTAEQQDPSALARLGRDQLMAQATELGLKVKAKARKAEIIEALVSAGGDDTGDAEDSTAQAADAQSSEAAERDANDSDTDDQAPERAPTQTHHAGDDSDDGQGPDRNSDGGGRGGRGRQNNQGRDGDQNNQGNQKSQPQGQAGARDDAESGNRRRRRRGRDRNDELFEGEPVPVEGYLDLRDDGYGFLRVSGYLPSTDDVYVAMKQVRQLQLRKGDFLTGASRPPSRSEKNPALLRVDTINGVEPSESADRPVFEDLVPLYPDERLSLEADDDPTDGVGRLIDIIAPIGKGQRALIAAPPKTGATTLIKQLVHLFAEVHPDVERMVLLLDERPEEVTDMSRSVPADVVASTFDRPPEELVQVAELTLERAKRMVETGADVLLVVDDLTSLAKAYDAAAGGKNPAGDIDTSALYPPRAFFGAARNLEDGGSLTIIATVATGSDNGIENQVRAELTPAANMILVLDAQLADARMFPAIDVAASGTRQEELLYPEGNLEAAWEHRRTAIAEGEGPDGAVGVLRDRVAASESNADLFA